MWHAAVIADTAGFTFVVKQKRCQCFQGSENAAKQCCRDKTIQSTNCVKDKACVEGRDLKLPTVATFVLVVSFSS